MSHRSARGWLHSSWSNLVCKHVGCQIINHTRRQLDGQVCLDRKVTVCKELHASMFVKTDRWGAPQDSWRALALTRVLGLWLKSLRHVALCRYLTQQDFSLIASIEDPRLDFHIQVSSVKLVAPRIRGLPLLLCFV